MNWVKYSIVPLVILAFIASAVWYCRETRRRMSEHLQQADTSTFSAEEKARWNVAVAAGDLPDDFGIELTESLMFRLNWSTILEYYRWPLIVITLLFAGVLEWVVVKLN